MTRRVIKPLSRPMALAASAMACSAAFVLCVPSAGADSSGGAGMAPSPGAGGGSSAATAQPGNLTVSATGDGMTIAARESALLRASLRVSGSLPSGDAGRVVRLEASGAKTGWRWQSIAQTRARSDGTFSALWKTNHAGQFALRAVAGQADASAASGLPTIEVSVYRPALATLYGPGFYGRLTACGTRLRRSTLGVANRTLPCGTPVTLYYGGQILTVRVIDRGPYANGADWDLTMATGKALGMDTTARIGAIALPR